MKAFLICPVRGADPEQARSYVELLEKKGWTVHWPPRDTNQDDPTGLDICKQNREAIRQADRVFIIWDGKSTGSLFDLGMAFAMDKYLVVLEAPNPTANKSFQNMMRSWEQECTQRE